MCQSFLLFCGCVFELCELSDLSDVSDVCDVVDVAHVSDVSDVCVFPKKILCVIVLSSTYYLFFYF